MGVARIAVEPGAELTLGIMAGGKRQLPREAQFCGSEKGGRELKAGTSIAWDLKTIDNAQDLTSQIYS